MKTERRLILVTGVPRSGTTAVGQMLSLAAGAGALHEPFNYHSGLQQIAHYFAIPGTAFFSIAQFDQVVAQIKNLELDFKPGIFPSDKGLRRAMKYVVGARPLNSYRRLRLSPNLRTVIWKDPLACFAANHAAQRHEVEVLVTLRNPWAVAGSFKRMEWAFDLVDLTTRLKQAGADFVPTCEARLDKNLHDPATNGTWLWRLVYSTLAQWAQANPRIHFVNLDDVVENPAATYAKLYKLLALAWNDHLAAKIAKYYQNESQRSTPKSKRAHDAGRNIADVNKYWRGYLAESEKEFVNEVAGAQWSELQKICIRL
jgi:hypothetical protein